MKKEKMLKNVCSKMAKVGLELCIKPRRISAGVDAAFSLPEPRNTNQINFWSGRNADFTLTVLATSKKYRQAVVRLVEPERTISNRINCQTNLPFSEVPKTNWEFRLRQSISIPVFEGQETDVSVKQIRSIEQPSYYHRWKHYAKVSIRVPATDIFFLMGFDEEHTFISVLPEPVFSIRQAHSVLEPAEVKKAKEDGWEVLRQGELFFIEASEVEKNHILTEMKSVVSDRHKYGYGNPFSFKGRGLDLDNNYYSDHLPLFVFDHDKDVFVSGAIGNARHFLALDGWYRVVPNRELPPPTGSGAFD